VKTRTTEKEYSERKPLITIKKLHLPHRNKIKSESLPSAINYSLLDPSCHEWLVFRFSAVDIFLIYILVLL
jgi:hypothetical protein